MQTKSDKDAVAIYNLHESDDDELDAILDGQGDSGTCDMCHRGRGEYIGRRAHMLHFRCGNCGWVTSVPDDGTLGE